MEDLTFLPGIQLDIGNTTTASTAIAPLDGGININNINNSSSSLWSNDTAAATAAATTTSPSDNIIMSPDEVTATQTTTPTNFIDPTSMVEDLSTQDGSENSTTTTTTTTPKVVPTTTTSATTQRLPAMVPTPVVIKAPAPNPATPGSSCSDLRDRISIDISITTSSSKANDNNNNNNNSNNNNDDVEDFAPNGSTRRRGDTDPIGTARTLAQHKMASSGSQHAASKQSRHGVILSTADHRVGTIVQVTCASDHHSVVLKCNTGGFWNGTMPTCRGGLDTSPYRLYLTVAGAVGGLVLLVLFILYCHLLRVRRKGGKRSGRSNSSMRTRDTDHNLYVDPYHVGERLYGSPNSPHFARTDITYAKPIVYSTYLNPAFYEDAYERWRRQEQMVSERLYDSPWLKPRGLQTQMDTPGFKWSQNSLKNIGDSAFKKLPRAHISTGHGSNMAHDPSRSRGQLNSQSPSIASMETGMLRLYPSMAAHDPRAHPMTSSDDALTEDNQSLSGVEQKSTDDGRTNF